MTTFHEFDGLTLEGQPIQFSDFAGTVLLVVNVASECGLTPHYAGLEALHRELGDGGAEGPRPFSVVGFPCNQFGAQEPGDAETIRSFCSTRFDVTFPMMAKIEVNGERRHPAWEFLCAADSGPDGPGDVAWNFAKFLVDREGKVLARYAPTVTPEDPNLRAAIADAVG